MSKVNTGFLNFVNKKKYTNIPNDMNLGNTSETEDQEDISTPLKTKPKQKIWKRPESSSKIKENEIIFENVSQNDNNLNDGSLKSLLERLSGKVIEKEMPVLAKDEEIEEEEESESESENENISDSEESDYEEEKYNHFIKNRLDIVQDADEQELLEEEQEEEEEETPNGEKIEVEIFVDYIPTYHHEKQIVKFFRNTDPSINRVKVLKDQSGHHKGKAYLKFSSKKNAMNLIKKGVYMDNVRLLLKLVDPALNVNNVQSSSSNTQSKAKFEQNKSYVKKDFSSQPAQQIYKKNNVEISNQSTLTVFVRNLPAHIEENVIKSNLKKFGKIKSVRFMKNNLGKNKNFGYVDFYNAESVNKAVENKDPIIVGGKQLVLEKAKTSFDQGVFEEGKRLGKKKQRTLMNNNNKNI